MSKEAQSHELTYDLIKRAVHGDQEAIEAYISIVGSPASPTEIHRNLGIVYYLQFPDDML